MNNVFHLIIGSFFSFLITILVIQNNSNEFLSDVSDFKKATIYFKQSTLAQEAEMFAQQKLQNVESINKISRDTAINEFKSTFGDFSKNISDLDTLTDLVPISYEIVFHNTNDRTNFIKSESNNELVDEIIATDQILSKYSTLQSSIRILIIILFSLCFLVCSLLTSLLIKNIVGQDQRQIEILALFGVSYHQIITKYFKMLFRYFWITVAVAVVVSYIIFFIVKYKINLIVELKFIAERLTFLSLHQIIILILCFAIAYFGGLYFVLNKLILRSYQR